MPEGDTIHKVAAALAPSLEGRDLAAGRLSRFPDVALAGRRIERVAAHGKHLLIALDDGRVLRSHLGMYGSWHRYARHERWRKPARRAAVVLETDEEVLVCFDAKEVEVIPGAGVRATILRQRLGPDLARDDADLGVVPARAREFLEADAPIADVLLDQRVACGIGNVYKSEVLFIERVQPRRALAGLDDAALVRLYARAADLLRRNLDGGPRVTRFERDGRGSVWVYGRAGEPCLACDASISRARIGRDLRATYWCGRCQLG